MFWSKAFVHLMLGLGRGGQPWLVYAMETVSNFSPQGIYILAVWLNILFLATCTSLHTFTPHSLQVLFLVIFPTGACWSGFLTYSIWVSY